MVQCQAYILPWTPNLEQILNDMHLHPKLHQKWINSKAPSQEGPVKSQIPNMSYTASSFGTRDLGVSNFYTKIQIVTGHKNSLNNSPTLPWDPYLIEQGNTELKVAFCDPGKIIMRVEGGGGERGVKYNNLPMTVCIRTPGGSGLTNSRLSSSSMIMPFCRSSQIRGLLFFVANFYLTSVQKLRAFECQMGKIGMILEFPRLF